MSDSIANALKRKKELERELAEIDQFLALHRKYSGTKSEDAETAFRRAEAEFVMKRHAALIEEHTMAPGTRQSGFLLRRRGAPANFAEIAERVIRDVGKPMTRTELVDAIEGRGVVIPSSDKARYIGTILWRHDRVFENHEGIGYWLRGMPLPATITTLFPST